MRDAALVGSLQHEIGGRLHQVLQPSVDALLGPPLPLQVLHPLQVAHGDTAGAPEDVRDDPDTAIVQEEVAIRRGGVIRELETKVARTRSAPSPRIVFVVARSRLDLYRQLARAFDGSDQVETILDRRTDAPVEGVDAGEWADVDRRAGPADLQLETLGWFIAWQAPRPSYRDIFESLRAAPAAPRREDEPVSEAAIPVAASAGVPETGDAAQHDIGTINASDLSRAYRVDRAMRTPAAFPESPRHGPRAPLRVAGLALAVGLCAAAGLYATTRLWSPSPPPAAPVAAPPRATSPTAQALKPAAPVRAPEPAPAAEPPRAVEPPRAPEPRRAEEPAVAVRAAVESPAARRAHAERDLEAALVSWADAANRGAANVGQWYADPVPVLYDGKNVPRSAVAAARKKVAAGPGRIDVRAEEPTIRWTKDDLAATVVVKRTARSEGARANRRAGPPLELSWKKTDAGWRIVGERLVREPASPAPASPAPASPVTLPKRS